MVDMQQAVMDQMLVGMLSQVESAIDDEMNKIENMNDDDIEKVRRNRIAEMKKKAELKQQWQNQGHGTVAKIVDQQDFFAACKHSERVVVLFNRESNKWGKIMLEHLQVLAARHMEARILWCDAEKAPFLTNRLNIYMLPTLVCIKGNKVHKQHNGLDEIDGSGRYSSGMLEYLLHTDEIFDDSPLYEQEMQDEQDELNELDLDD